MSDWPSTLLQNCQSRVDIRTTAQSCCIIHTGAQLRFSCDLDKYESSVSEEWKRNVFPKTTKCTFKGHKHSLFPQLITCFFSVLFTIYCFTHPDDKQRWWFFSLTIKKGLTFKHAAHFAYGAVFVKCHSRCRKCEKRSAAQSRTEWQRNTLFIHYHRSTSWWLFLSLNEHLMDG